MMENVPEAVKKCVEVLKHAGSDTEKFAGLFMVAKLTKSADCGPESKRLIFEAIGLDFLRKLLTSHEISVDCPPELYKSVALSILSSLVIEPELAGHKDVLSLIPSLLEIVQQTDDEVYDNELILVTEAYDCLKCMADNDKGKEALFVMGAIPKLTDIYSQQNFQSDEALHILVTLIQHYGTASWDANNAKSLHTLLNKIALDFETDHSERKFELCGILQALLLSCDRSIISLSADETWPASIHIGLNDILTSKIGKAQRDPALKLSSVVVDLLGVEWTLSDEEKPKQFLLLLIHLCSVEIRMQLEDRNFETIMKNADLITSCFLFLELAISYITSDNIDLEQKEKQQLYTALKGAFAAVMSTILKLNAKLSKGKLILQDHEKIFVCAMLRVLAAWLAQETSTLRSTVHEVLPFVLTFSNDTFYAYRSRYIAEKNKTQASSNSNNEVSSDPTSNIDVLRPLLPGMCHLTIEEEGRGIMLRCKEEEVLLDCFSFHWSIVDWKKPLVPKSERLKAKKNPEPTIPPKQLEEMADSRAAMISMCNIFMNIVVIEPKIAEASPTFSSLLKFILNNLPDLRNTPENLVLHGNMAVLGLLLLKQQSKKVKKNDFSICRYIQSTIRFLWDAYNVDESNNATTLVVSMAYKKHWIELMELWFLGMQTMSAVVSLIPWISEFAIETGWAQGIVDTLKKVKMSSLAQNTRSAYEDFLCHLVAANEDVIQVLKDHDILTVCQKHLFMELGKRIFGD